MLTAQQINWAAQHDWFHSVQDSGRVCLYDRWVDRTGQSHEHVIVWFESFTALKQWAGY